MYRLSHTNVDGYGHIGYYPTLREATAEADRLQAAADSRGNTWGYSYHVWVNDHKVYTTHYEVLIRAGAYRVLVCASCHRDGHDIPRYGAICCSPGDYCLVCHAHKAWHFGAGGPHDFTPYTPADCGMEEDN